MGRVRELEEQMDKKRERIERAAINAKLLINVEFVRALMIRVISANQTAIPAKFRELALPITEADNLIERIGLEFDRQMAAAFPVIAEEELQR